MLAEIALAASDGERNHHAIAFLDAGHLRTYIHYFPHEFVAENVPRLERRNIAIIEMKVGTANRRAGNADDSIAWIQDRWVTYALDFKLGFSLPTKSFHNSSSNSIACKALGLHIHGWVFAEHDSLG